MQGVNIFKKYHVRQILKNLWKSVHASYRYVANIENNNPTDHQERKPDLRHSADVITENPYVLFEVSYSMHVKQMQSECFMCVSVRQSCPLIYLHMVCTGYKHVTRTFVRLF